MPKHSSKLATVPSLLGCKRCQNFLPTPLPGHELMPLKLRPTGLGSGIDKERPDYTVVTGEWEVGRIYETRGGPDSLRWF